jgi:syntaxin 16
MTSPGPGTSTPVQNPYSDPSMMESETDRSLSQSTLQQTAQKHLYGDNEGVIAQREKEINEIAQGIIELANIFQELQTMVIDQGTLLDRIDYNVEKMSTDVKAAAEELTVASGYQRKSLKRKVMLLLVILIAGVFILLGLKLSQKGSPSPPPPAPVPVAPIEDAPSSTTRFVVRRFPPHTMQERGELGSHSKRNWRRRRRRSRSILQ